jgi:hypothetical protein
VILRSSARLGIWIGDFFKDLDIPLDLSSVGAPKADDPSDIGSINEGDVVENPGVWRQGQDSRLPIVMPVIDPEQSTTPVEFLGETEGQSVLLEIEAILVGVEVESHALM